MSQPSISSEPLEYQVLEAARATLAAAVGASYIYDAADAVVVPAPMVHYLGETKMEDWPRTFYLVSPGDATLVPDTTCATLFTGDFVVTGAVRFETPELPWTGGYVPQSLHQLRIFEDILTALHEKDLAGAHLAVANRQLDLTVDGWAVIQAQIGFTFSRAD